MGTRTQYPVGQGCFHAGTLEWGKDPQQRFDYVYDCGGPNNYDCGGPNKSEPLKHSINAMVKRLRVGEDDRPVLDDLYISHLHEDHVNGLDQLLRKVQPYTVFIPEVNVVARVANLIAAASATAPSNELIEMVLDPPVWFEQRGVFRIVEVQPSVPDEGIPDDDTPRYADIPRGRSEGSRTPERLSMKSGEMVSPFPDYRGQPQEWVLVPHVDPDVDPESSLRSESALKIFWV